MTIYIGCDPEVFLFDESKKQFISADGLFPGTKKEPFKVKDGAIQVDGVALEFNIDPVDNEEAFLHNVRSVFDQMSKMVKDVSKHLSIRCVPVARFDAGYWSKVNPDAKVLGCDPDYKHTGEINNNPTELLNNIPLRTGSGHIHIGWRTPSDVDSDHVADCQYIANEMHGRHWYHETDSRALERLKYYGHNGSYRPKPYGIELRSASNLWLNTPEETRKVYLSARETFNKVTGL